MLFDELKKQTTYKFFYNDDQVRDMKRLSVSANDETVESVLDKVFRNTKYTYRISGDQIIVVKRQETEQKQQVIIEGVVVEKDSLPIAGATVVLQGTTSGFATDIAGKFKLVVPLENEIYIEVSFLGMKKQVLKVLGLPTPAPMRIVMEPDVMGMDEVLGQNTVTVV